MSNIVACFLKQGDIEPGTECQARDGELYIGDLVARCPECGRYCHVRCWRANNKRCPMRGCEGKCTELILPEEDIIVIDEQERSEEDIIVIVAEEL